MPIKGQAQNRKAGNRPAEQEPEEAEERLGPGQADSSDEVGND
jgi:hypothetical protein